ncbi:MAG: hypothetical protein R2789_13440 [Microthrixaceae bacterium]
MASGSGTAGSVTSGSVVGVVGTVGVVSVVGVVGVVGSGGDQFAMVACISAIAAWTSADTVPPASSADSVEFAAQLVQLGQHRGSPDALAFNASTLAAILATEACRSAISAEVKLTLVGDRSLHLVQLRRHVGQRGPAVPGLRSGGGCLRKRGGRAAVI